MSELSFSVSTEVIPTNKSSKYDGVITAIKALTAEQHLQVNTATGDEAIDVSNAIRSAAKGRGMSLNVVRRGNVLYIKEKKS